MSGIPWWQWYSRLLWHVNCPESPILCDFAVCVTVFAVIVINPAKSDGNVEKGDTNGENSDANGETTMAG